MFAVTQVLAFLTMAGLLLNEVYGPALLMVSLAGWLVVYLAYWKPMGRETLAQAGILVWLVPMLAVASTVWSQEPSITFRAAIETVMTVALMACVARNVSPFNFIVTLFVSLALIAVVSIPINNASLDGMTGETNRTGIFLNKNSFSICSSMLILTSLVLFADRRTPRWLKFILIPLIGLAAVQNVMSRSVGSTLLIVLSMSWGAVIFGVKLFPARVRKTYVTLVVAGGVILLAAGAFIAIAFEDELLAMVGKDPTLTGRTELWFYAARYLTTSPPLGVGYDAFWVQGYALPEFLWNLEHIEARGGFSFHSLYYELAVQLGWPGVVSAALVIIMTFLCVVEWVRTDTSSESVFFFCVIVFQVVLQIQAAFLFITFDPWYATFSLALLYGRKRTRTSPRHNVSSSTMAVVGASEL